MYLMLTSKTEYAIQQSQERKKKGPEIFPHCFRCLAFTVKVGYGMDTNFNYLNLSALYHYINCNECVCNSN